MTELKMYTASGQWVKLDEFNEDMTLKEFLNFIREYDTDLRLFDDSYPVRGLNIRIMPRKGKYL